MSVVFSSKYIRSIINPKTTTSLAEKKSSFLTPFDAPSPGDGDLGQDAFIFEDLHSETGFYTAESYYLKRKSQSHNDQFDEMTFLDFVRRLSDISDAVTLDLFDYLDAHDSGSLRFPEFFLALAMFTARESGKTSKLLYVHQTRLFELFGGDLHERIPARCVFDLTRLMSLPERAVRELLTPYNLDIQVNKEEFALLLFVVFRWWDERHAVRKQDPRRDSGDSDMLLQKFVGSDSPPRGVNGRGSRRTSRRQGQGGEVDNPGWCSRHCVIS